MDLVIKICEDITFPCDKDNIIKKYLLPFLLQEPEKLLDIKPELLTNIFNILDPKEIKILSPYIEKIVGEINIEEFNSIKWKIKQCSDCKQIKHVLKCKNQHVEDCPCLDFTSYQGCNNYFCEDCIYQICSDMENDLDCPSFRCKNCCEF
jgi:hypothetical protein